MGITKLITQFYRELDSTKYRQEPGLGQICWAPICHLDPIPRILEVERAQPQEHYATKFEIVFMKADHFKKGRNRLPIKTLNLRENEDLIIARSKLRPAIIVATEKTVFSDLKHEIQKRYHLQDDTILIIPLYGVESESHEGGISSKMATRAKAMMYRQLFYCPRYKSLTQDSIARLDRIQAINVIHPTYTPEPFALSDESLGVLLSMLQAYFGAEENENLKIIKELCLESLPDDAKP